MNSLHTNLPLPAGGTPSPPRSSTVLFWALSLVILIVGIKLRFSGLLWDQRSMLHPDERFIVYVVEDIRWPASPGQYFDTNISPLNPHNKGHKLYVYGTLPLIAIKAVTDKIRYEGRYGGLIPSRVFSALLDCGSLILVILTAHLIAGRAAALTAGTLAAFCVVHIQLSHFGTFDTWAAFFVTLALYFCVRTATLPAGRLWPAAVGFGVAVGCAGACKINTALVLPWFALALLLARIPFARSVNYFLFSSLVAFTAFRLAQPYAFAGPNWWNLELNPALLENFHTLRKISEPNALFPPSIQWINRSGWYAFGNLAIWGLGLPAGIYAFASWILACMAALLGRGKSLFIPITWILAGHLVFGVLPHSPAMRYQIAYVPMLFVCCGWLMARVQLSRPVYRVLGSMLALICIFGSALWALAFCSIYGGFHPRVAALFWVGNNIAPRQFKAVYETIWDDALPAWMPAGRRYRGHLIELPRLEPAQRDDIYKAQRFAYTLAESDYFLITSNRQWASIGRLPRDYPMMQRFYRKLLSCPASQGVLRCYAKAEEGILSEELGFRLIKTFHSYPRLWGWEINDQLAEESFTVYDHPKVFIFHNEIRLTPQEIIQALTGGTPKT